MFLLVIGAFLLVFDYKTITNLQCKKPIHLKYRGDGLWLFEELRVAYTLYQPRILLKKLRQLINNALFLLSTVAAAKP